MATEQDKKKARETEIAKRLSLIFDRMPLAALNSLLANLCDGIRSEIGDSAEPPQRQWHVVTDLPREVHVHTPAAVSVEVLPSEKTSKRRFDLVVPIPAIVLGGRIVTTLIFEFKLGFHSIDQLRSYTSAAPNSLVISIATNGDNSEMINEFKNGKLIVFQQWNHLYFVLQSMLSGDSQTRTVLLEEEPDELLLKIDHRVAGQDRLAFQIEDFLALTVDRGLLSNPNLVLVVPEGGPAQQTLSHDPPYYCHPIGWRAGYRYLVSIAGNEVKKVFVVDKSVATDKINDQLPDHLPGLKDDWPTIAASGGSRVSLLRPPNRGETNLGDYIGKRYSRRTKRKTSAAFTMSHRYLDHPDELALYFK